MIRTGIRSSILFAGLVLAASNAAAQQPQWTAPIPRSELYGTYQQGEVYAVDFLNRHVGWAVGGHGSSGKTLVFRTTDGGESWQRLPLYDGVQHVPNFTDIRFADANNGWLLAERLLLRTGDGGDSWEPVQTPDLSIGFAQTLMVLGPDAVMVGTNSVNGRQIHVTTDGGASWRTSTVSESGNDDVVDLAATPDGRFFAAVASAYLNRGAIYGSQDGGRSWTAVVETDKRIEALAFSEDGSNGVAVGEGFAYWTADGGSTWRRAVAPGRNRTAAFLHGRTVIALGNRPSLIVSDDGGRTWRAAAGPDVRETGYAVDVAVVDPGWWFVAGGRGANAVFRFEDASRKPRIAGARLPFPRPFHGAAGEPLPPGVYDVEVVHDRLDHELVLTLEEPAEGIEVGVEGNPEDGEYACDPCETAFPVELEYEREPLADGDDPRTFLKVSLEPTPDGVALVLHAAATPPRDLHRALAALGASSDADIDARATVRAAAEQKKQGGGLFGRIKKAASGDLRGAVEDAVNPQQAVQRYEAAAAGGPPAYYTVKLRYPIDLFGEAAP